MIREICETCHHFHAAKQGDVGECHARAPQMVVTQTMSMDFDLASGKPKPRIENVQSGGWAPTRKDCACGEWTEIGAGRGERP